jgi:plasmid maintenance system antidote protein VapI
MAMKSNTFYPQSIPAPGGTLKEKLEEMGISPIEFAKRIDATESFVMAIFSGQEAITPPLAIVFEGITSIPSRCWMNGERAYRNYLKTLHAQ